MTSRTTRQARVLDLLRRHDVRSQGELLSLLSAEGVAVTQATLSRDLVEVGAVKVRRGRQLVYAVPEPGSTLAVAGLPADRPGDGPGDGRTGGPGHRARGGGGGGVSGGSGGSGGSGDGGVSGGGGGAGTGPMPVRLRRAADELLVDARTAGNQVVLRTPPGAANYLASCIDQSHLTEVLGTIAGDDTVLVVAATPAAARRLVRALDPLRGPGR